MRALERGLCKIEGCEKPVTRPSFGWCESHYYRNRKYGSPQKSKRKNSSDMDIVIVGDYAEVSLTNGGKTKVDIEDVDRVRGFCWSRTSKKSPYVRGYVGGENVLMQRYLMNPPDVMVVDHINHDVLDNRKVNLRICTKQENLWNLKSRGSTSVYRGVSWCKANKRWKASICKDGVRYTVGYFKTEDAAFGAYNAKAKELFGEYAIIQAIAHERRD